MAKLPANINLPELNQRESAALIGEPPKWIRNYVPAPGKGKKYNSREVVAIYVNYVSQEYERKLSRVRSQEAPSELDDISRRKKLAEAERAERELRLADLRIARLESKLMPVDWVHRMLEEMSAEIRKPLEIIGRNHPEYQQMVLNGIDNAMDKLATMISDDQISE